MYTYCVWILTPRAYVVVANYLTYFNVKKSLINKSVQILTKKVTMVSIYNV